MSFSRCFLIWIERSNFTCLTSGLERPIVFVSRSLTASEKKLPAREGSVVTGVYSQEVSSISLYRCKFIFYTDHKPLTIILSTKKGIPPLASARLQR